jgi:hypothetical protein
LGVGVGLAVGSELSVAGFGPGVAAPAVPGEVAERVAELLVAAEAEGDGSVPAAGAGGGCDAGEAAERFGVGESGAAVTDLGEEGGGADGGAAGQGAEDDGVGVGVEELVEAGGELVDLGAEALEDGDVGEGDGTAGVAFVAGGAVGGSGEPAVELVCGLAAAVAVGSQPSAEALLGQPLGSAGGGEPLEEPQRDRAVDVAEQADSAGEHVAQVDAELVGDRDACLDEVLAGSHVGSQRDRGWTVGFEGSPTVSVGAQGVGQHVSVGTVGLVARGAVALSQRLDRPGRDHDHFQAGLDKRIDDGTIGPFDGHSLRSGSLDTRAQFSQSLSAVSDVELDDHLASVVDDAHGVRIGSPVDAGEAERGIMHVSLLAVAAVGKHPVVAGRVCRSLTDRRSGALSPIASRHVLGHRTSRNSSWRSSRKRTWRWPGGTHRCAGSLTATNTRMVDQ